MKWFIAVRITTLQKMLFIDWIAADNYTIQKLADEQDENGKIFM